MSTKNEAKPDKISDEQLLRASRSFEAMMLSQIDISAKLANDLKHAIRIGMVVLALIAISILVLLLTLSSQINRISDVVLDTNTNFSSVTVRMDHMSQYIDSMAKRVALLQLMDEQTTSMKNEISDITSSMTTMQYDHDEENHRQHGRQSHQRAPVCGRHVRFHQPHGRPGAAHGIGYAAHG